MKTILRLILTFVFFAIALTARAQETVWVQLEAVRTLSLGQDRARAYANAFQNINGFRAPGGWYAIALGPYTRETANAELQTLKRSGLIPVDSYIALGDQYRQQFWPVGANALNAAPVPPQAGTAVVATPLDQAPLQPAFVPDETPREARASERRLVAEERRALQEALQWEGVYSAAIDGAFGPGTRRAMADWQAAQGYDATGILTTAQRAELIDGYRDAFAELGLASVRDDAAGIEMILPARKVRHDRTEAPFVHYDATDDDGVRVVLISQTGDEATLFGLYDIMQTLEIVPMNGPRERKKRSFVLSGQSADIHSYTYAQLSDGAVKGFTLIWKPEDQKVMARVSAMMQESFTPLKGAVLPDTALSDDGASQRIDLLAGLEIRRPERSRSGFFVNGDGLVLTTTDLLSECRRLTIGDEIEADITARDDVLGLALLTPRTQLTPIAVAEFQASVPRLKSEVALAGFSYEDVLDLPIVTYGTLEDIRGLQGEDFVERLALSTLPGDAGGPVFDGTGAVLGMLLARSDTGTRKLPPEVNFAVDVPAIADFLGAAGLSPRASDGASPIDPEDLTTLAGDLTVRVSCWN